MVGRGVVPHRVRGSFSGAAGGRLPVACPAIAAPVRHDARGARRGADADRPRAARHAAPELPWAAPALPDRLVPAARAPGRGEGSDFGRNDLAVAIRALGDEL